MNRNVGNDFLDQPKLESEGNVRCDMTIPVKLFCPYGSHILFLHDVRQNYEKKHRNRNNKPTFNTCEGKEKLPRKLFRTGRQPWKPVPIFHLSKYAKLNWDSMTSDELYSSWKNDHTIIPDKCNRPRNNLPSNDENKENTRKKIWGNNATPKHCKPLPSKEEARKESEKDNNNNNNDNNNDTSNTSSGKENSKNRVLFKQQVDIDINDNLSHTKSSSLQQQSNHVKHNSVMASLSPKCMDIKKKNPNKTEQQYKIEKESIVLHFNTPVFPKKYKDIEKDNLLHNSSLSEDDNTALPLNAPIIEKDILSFPAATTLSLKRRKTLDKVDKNDTKEIRKLKTVERNDAKEHRKLSWFTKNEHKQLAVDTNNEACTDHQKSKFKKQHRKSKSVMLQPTYLTTKQDDKVPFKEQLKAPPCTMNRKSSVGNTQREIKTEKLSLFRRIYSSPQTEMKFDKIDIALPKRTRRHTQPVGNIQREFIRELKGKLDSYSAEHRLKGDEANDNVVWKINI